MTLSEIHPEATMEEAWARFARRQAESDRLRAECVRLEAEGELIVLVTAQKLFGRGVQINWEKRTATRGEDLPTPSDIRGIMPNLTQGKPSEYYLKERWGGR